MSSRRSILFAEMVAVVLLAAAPARAQGASQAATAEVLFQEGLKLLDAGKIAEACPKFEASQRLDPGYGTLFNLAECHEKNGQTASAWAEFREAVAMAKKTGETKREEKASRRADALEPGLLRMVISVSSRVASLDGLEIKRDGIRVEKAAWGLSIPVDPGKHVITARASGKKPWDWKGRANEASAKIEVVIPMLEDLPKQAVVSTTIPPVDEPQRRSPALALILGGTAVVTFGVGGALLAVSSGKASDVADQATALGNARKNCLPTSASYDQAACTTLEDTARSADTLHNAGIALFVVGGVAAAGAITWLLLPAPKPQKRGALELHPVPVVGPGQAGLLLSGAF